MHSGKLFIFSFQSFRFSMMLPFIRYDFDSWREFSYLDEENLESAQRSEICVLQRNRDEEI